jgi:hypothetical protein
VGDISDPLTKKINASNSFSLPITSKNARALNFMHHPMSTGGANYETTRADIIALGNYIVFDGRAFVQKVGERYEVAVVSGKSVIDVMKETKLRDLMRSSFSDGGKSWVSLEEALEDVKKNNILSLNLVHWALEEEWYEETNLKIHTNGLFSIRPKKVVQWIENLTGYSILNAGSIFDDTIFNSLNIPFYDLILFKFYDSGNGWWKFYLYDDPTIQAAFDLFPINQKPRNIVEDFSYYGDKSVLDFLKTLAIMFGAIIEVDDVTKVINITKFNDIKEGEAVLDWSKKIIKSEKFFSFGNYAQTNTMRYKVDDGVSKDSGAFSFSCNNKNIEVLKESTIDCFIPRFYESRYLLGSTSDKTIFTDKPFNEIIILKDNGDFTEEVTPFFAHFQDSDLKIYNDSFDIRPTLLTGFDFSEYYEAIEEALTNPIKYEAEIFLNTLDFINFRASHLVRIDPLGGVFYVNKINGFNPKAKGGTKVELIKIK